MKLLAICARGSAQTRDGKRIKLFRIKPSYLVVLSEQNGFRKRQKYYSTIIRVHENAIKMAEIIFEIAGWFGAIMVLSAYPPAALNMIWSLIAIYGLIRSFKK